MRKITIGEVAARTGLRASAIRYYETQGLLPAAARRGGKRVYDSSILERLAMIDLAKTAGLSLSDIRSLLTTGEVGQPRAAWKRFAQMKRAEIAQDLERLSRRKHIVTALGRCNCVSLDACGRAFADALSRYRTAEGKRESAWRPSRDPSLIARRRRNSPRG